MTSLGAQGFGAGMSAVGAIFGAMQQRDELRYKANIADINARIADGNARNIVHAGIVEESRVKLRNAQAKGASIAQIAGSGVDLGSATAVARLTGTDLIGEVDANQVRANALRSAWGQRIEAGNQRRGAAAFRGTAASISPAMAGITSLVNSAGQVAQSWYSMNKEGAFDKAPKKGTATISAGYAPTGDDIIPAADWAKQEAPFGPTYRKWGEQRPNGLGYGRGY